MSNFGFLEQHDVRLATLGALAERYFRDDPPTAIVKLRQFAEFLAKLIAAHHALYIGERETFEETLRRLSFERIVPKEAADLFHALRKFGNAAVHDAKGNHAEALASLKFARQLGIWFHRTYGRQPNFNPGAFVPPPEPIDAAAPLRGEIEALRRKLAESVDAVTAARRHAEEQVRARESVEEPPSARSRGAGDVGTARSGQRSCEGRDCCEAGGVASHGRGRAEIRHFSSSFSAARRLQKKSIWTRRAHVT